MMTMLLALRLLLTPFFIAVVSLAGRRWGPTVSGLLTGLPLTSGPISLILAIQDGRDFAARAASGNLAGQASVCIFCLAYSLAARKWNWLASGLIAVVAFLASVYLWNLVSLSLPVAFAGLLGIILVVLRLIPRVELPYAPVHTPAWDLPARMIVAASFVVLLTSFAHLLGPQLSGLLSPFPVFGVVLATFTHHQQGGPSAVRLMRGLVAGSAGYTAFFVVIGLLLPRTVTAPTYLLAALAAVAVNAAVFMIALQAPRKG